MAPCRPVPTKTDDTTVGLLTDANAKAPTVPARPVSVTVFVPTPARVGKLGPLGICATSAHGEPLVVNDSDSPWLVDSPSAAMMA